MGELLSKVGNWLWGAIKILSRIKTLEARVAELEASLSRIERDKPPKPDNLRVAEGVYWGLHLGDSEDQAYCAACGSDGRWVPLATDYQTNYADGHQMPKNEQTVRLNCPVAKEHRTSLTGQQYESASGKSMPHPKPYVVHRKDEPDPG